MFLIDTWCWMMQPTVGCCHPQAGETTVYKKGSKSLYSMVSALVAACRFSPWDPDVVYLIDGGHHANKINMILPTSLFLSKFHHTHRDSNEYKRWGHPIQSVNHLVSWPKMFQICLWATKILFIINYSVSGIFFYSHLKQTKASIFHESIIIF